jgi:hypothetical protein
MKDEFKEFMEWMKTQPDRTAISAVIIRLWDAFQKEKTNKYFKSK